MEALSPQTALVQRQNNTLTTDRDEIKSALMWGVVETSLKEASVATVITGASLLFSASAGASFLFVAVTVAAVVVNIIIRATSAIRAYEVVSRERLTERDIRLCQLDVEAVEWGSAEVYATLDLLTRDVVCHEMGHAAAALMVYEKADPTIIIKPGGGMTSYFDDTLSAFGKRLGAGGSDLFVTAAGTGVTMGISLAGIAFHHYYADSHPYLSKCSLLVSLQSIGTSAGYAFSALSTTLAESPGHDFVRMAQYLGVNPIALVVGIILIPVAFKIALIAYDHFHVDQDAQEVLPR